jgi:serine/threonine-protein kinase
MCRSPSGPRHSLSSLLDRYSAAAYGLLEVFDLLSDPFGDADAIKRALVVLAVFGFFITLVLAWFHAEKGRQRATAVELVVLAVLTLGSIPTAVVSYRMDSGVAPVADANVESVLTGPVVAVLPFEDLSRSDEDAKHIVDGVHAEILANLSELTGLNAISRTSVVGYDRVGKTVRQIADDLGVSAILEGQVEKAGDALRITVTLIDGMSDVQIWGQIYDRLMDPSSVLAVRGEIAAAIADALAVTLAPEEQSRLSRVATRDEGALDLYMRGRQAEDRADRGEADFFPVALQYYEQALEQDSLYAEAAAGRARMTWSVYWKIPSPRTPELTERIRITAERAVELGPELAESHLALGEYYRWHTADYSGALTSTQTARRLDRDNVRVLTALARLNMNAGDFGTARVHLERAAALDPLDGQSQRAAGMVAFYQRRYDAAETHLLRAARRFARDLDEDEPALEDRIRIREVYMYLMGIYVAADGDTDRAFRALREVIETTEMTSTSTSIQVAGFGVSGPVSLGRTMLAMDSVQALLVEGQIIRPAQAMLLRLAGEDPEEQRRLWDVVANRQLDDQLGATGLQRYSDVFLEFEGRSVGALALALAGRNDVALAQLERAREIAATHVLAEFALDAEPLWATTLVEVGEYEQALDLLEDMMSRPSAMSTGLLRIQPEWDPIRDQPRFQRLLEAG